MMFGPSGCANSFNPARFKSISLPVVLLGVSPDRLLVGHNVNETSRKVNKSNTQKGDGTVHAASLELNGDLLKNEGKSGEKRNFYDIFVIGRMCDKLWSRRNWAGLIYDFSVREHRQNGRG